MVNIGNSWDKILKEDFESENYLQLRKFLVSEYNNYTIYPDKHDLFNALKLTPYENVKVVILGQDPYFCEGQAHGLCFSVKRGIQVPPSLQNIYKELYSDLNVPIANHGYLEKWAKEGVLLLNTVLTVREKQPNSHKGKGWEILTDSIIKKLNDRKEPIVFMLWGANAKSKETLINKSKHLVLTTSHPSPLSAYNGFLGCKHFSKANDFLQKNNINSIDWNLD